LSLRLLGVTQVLRPVIYGIPGHSLMFLTLYIVLHQLLTGWMR
jgi:hypothetical protein